MQFSNNAIGKMEGFNLSHLLQKECLHLLLHQCTKKFFSEAGNAIEERRSRMTPKHEELLVLLHHNI